MKKVLVKDLKEGAVYSRPVYIDGDNLFVPAGVAVREKDIARLHSWGVESVETEGVLVDTSPGAEKNQVITDPFGSDILSNTDPVPSASNDNDISLSRGHENKGPYDNYIELIKSLDEVCINISSGVSVKASFIDDISGRLLHIVRDNRQSMIGFILGGEIKGRTMAKSLVNTAILSALIAEELKLLPHKILQVITGALLHDVGMLRMPKEIVEKRGGLSAGELQRIKSHPLLTYRIVTREFLYSEEVGLIVLQHHERWDGEGYPSGISGVEIDIGARIVSVADAFEAMVSHRPYRNSLMGYQAMKNLLSDNLKRFDPDVIKAFIQTMGIYPIGSFILLNNGTLAKVIKVQGNAPLRPTIRILIDDSGKVLGQSEEKVIDLLVEKNLFIARAVDPADLKDMKEAGRHG